MSGIALALGALLLAPSQQPVATEARERQDPAAQTPGSFGVELRSVYVDVFVSRGGEVVTGLDASNFVLRDEGVVQSVRLVALDAVPVSAVLAFDVSSSVEGPVLEDLRTAGHAIVAGLRDAKAVTLLSFNHVVRLLVTAEPDPARVHAALDRLRAGGATSLYDGLFCALALKSPTRRPVVVLFTDGADSTSWIDPATLRAAAVRANALLHVVGLGPERTEVRKSLLGLPEIIERESPRDALLRKLAEATGGRYWRAEGSGNLEATFLRLLSEMRQRYVLAYEPVGVPGPGEHQIEVALRGARGDVRSRRSYVATR